MSIQTVDKKELVQFHHIIHSVVKKDLKDRVLICKQKLIFQKLHHYTVLNLLVKAKLTSAIFHMHLN